MSSVKVPFGLLDGVLVEPGSVSNGKSCGCICPGCKRPLIAYNQGKVRTSKHFGHAPGAECAKGLESAVHLAAKEVLVAAAMLQRPALVVDVDGIVAPGRTPLWNREVEPQSLARYEEVAAEVDLELEWPADAPPKQADLFSVDQPSEPRRRVFRPDVRGTLAGVTDWIEIRVTHAVDAEKRRWLQKAGIRVIEIDLRDLLRSNVTLQEIRAAVVNSVERKTWVSHPDAKQAAADLSKAWDLKCQVETLAYVQEQAAKQVAPRRWIGDGEPDTRIDIDRLPQKQSDAELLTKLRERLGLPDRASLPRHLTLDIPSNGGCLVSNEVWLSQLFADWVHGRSKGRFLASDLVAAISRRFGVKSGYGHRDLDRAIRRRVLPYWAACGFLVVEGDVLTLTGKAISMRSEPPSQR